MKAQLLSLALALTACGAPAPTTSAVKADVNDVRYSTWSTTYYGPGFQVNATVVLDDTSGYYTTDSGDQGQLTGVRYAYITPDPDLKVGVYGTWSMNGQSGGFTFRV